ncbi:DUF397 domain-containing protein [Embleya sp. AB8]|uniref:DUF397 domain-containing protein n=1 Tax=Embleya sp. AB8 TaxID=3156304 RepID=UPI003C72D337
MSAITEQSNTGWRKSTYSGNTGDCVEIRDGLGVVPVRDSKDPSVGHLSIDPTAWASLVRTLKRA